MRKLTLFAIILALVAFAGLGCQDDSNPMDYEIADLPDNLITAKMTLPPGAISCTVYVFCI